jgi:phosphatidylserine/phosphatidylglycerophosphate/cardiolipin synthase-like enzyme
MLNYPRATLEQYRPVPAYRHARLPRQVLGIAAVGMVVALTALSANRGTFEQQAPTEISLSRLSPADTPRPAPVSHVLEARRADPDAGSERESGPYLFSGDAAVTLDFAPRSTSERLPAQVIRSAAKSIKLQSYDLETLPIRDAVLEALGKRVAVDIMVDHTAYLANKPKWNGLKRAGARILINARSGHAHDKTMIVDDTRVLLGSINFSRSGRDADLANTVLLENPELTKIYLAHWIQHAATATSK